jgi:hypothetical protein
MAVQSAKDKLKTGWIHVLVTFEIIGKPAKHVDESLRMFLDTVKKDPRVHWLEENVGEAEKSDGKEAYFSAFAEVDMLIKDFETMTWLAINFTPASIEVVEPTEFRLKALDVQNWQNDLLSHLHTVGIQFKQQRSHLEFLKEQMTKLIHNSILLSLARSPKTEAQIAKDTSLTKDTLEPQLKVLLKEKRIKEKKGVYDLA